MKHAWNDIGLESVHDNVKWLLILKGCYESLILKKEFMMWINHPWLVILTIPKAKRTTNPLGWSHVCSVAE